MAWAKTSRHQRGYGADHDRMRARLMQEVKLCEECRRQGIVTPGTIADHIVPKARGGGNERSNYQLLCKPCHGAKAASERGKMGISHPEWLKPSGIPLTIVCGPPGAGKTTYAEGEAAKVGGGYVIDLDRIVQRQTGTHGHQQDRGGDRAWLFPALYERNRLLGELAASAAGACWFIVMAPTAQERRWWADKLGGDVKLLDPGEALCTQRVGPSRAAAVHEWYARAALPWSHAPATPAVRKGCDLDGRPTDPNHPWNRSG